MQMFRMRSEPIFPHIEGCSVTEPRPRPSKAMFAFSALAWMLASILVVAILCHDRQHAAADMRLSAFAFMLLVCSLPSIDALIFDGERRPRTIEIVPFGVAFGFFLSQAAFAADFERNDLALGVDRIMATAAVLSIAIRFARSRRQRRRQIV